MVNSNEFTHFLRVIDDKAMAPSYAIAALNHDCAVKVSDHKATKRFAWFFFKGSERNIEALASDCGFDHSDIQDGTIRFGKL